MKIMFKINYINKIFLVSVFFIIFLLFFYYRWIEITGFNTLDVSIKEKDQGVIQLNYNTSINLTGIQNITAEFVNTGSSNYTAKIELTVYMYNNTSGNLEQIVDYYDNSILLLPGERKVFRVSFLPTKIGVYYIKARVPYDAKVAELWGSFFVSFFYTPGFTIIYVPISVGGGTIPGQKVSGITGLDIKYKNKIDLYPGQKVLIDIGLNNTGTINLHNLKFYSTVTQNINFEVNPKEIYELRYNESNLFLVSLELSEDIPVGEYDFFFQVLGLEVSKTGKIVLNVTSAVKPIKDEVYETILNYEYLITELDHEIYKTYSKGLDTSRAEGYLDDARRNLRKARDLYDEEKYEEAKDILDLVKRDLEKVVFELAAISFRVYIYPAFSPFLILILILMILIGIIILIYLYKKRKKKKKPKLLKEFTEEET